MKQLTLNRLFQTHDIVSVEMALGGWIILHKTVDQVVPIEVQFSIGRYPGTRFVGVVAEIGRETDR